MLEGLKSSFSTPWHELVTPNTGDGASSVLSGVSINAGITQGLQSSEKNRSGAGTQGDRASSSTLQLGVRYNPTSYWFATFTVYRYLRPSFQQSWDPDFTYSFGYDDWHPYTFSLIYGNFTGNRFAAGNGIAHSRIEQGGITLAYKFPLPDLLKPIFLMGNGDDLMCSASLTLVPRFTDAQSAVGNNKMNAGFGCRYTLPSGWYATFTAYHYLRPSQQQPWDPDFVYGFGYFDWHSDAISIQYNNYSGNRFPWRTHAPGTGTFRAGSISISWSHSW
ncbi:hypothetical protein BLA23254_07485 [Burkholderia lata]|uniref:Uncharacterized protein n=1 Tax=Burkholderia lata (strain ATCC 17760 / DSM 23089 / LMG 22485 / NCIMB 9086 / R18194 / 383) TaxID=482957 RepID=A0A6P2SPF3_BURL3|nr:hypothetical protein [Burkholderia lata]VWC47523.1 hypothetical protein BLA23254_07485 [Burkholderia lata]